MFAHAKTIWHYWFKWERGGWSWFLRPMSSMRCGRRRALRITCMTSNIVVNFPVGKLSLSFTQITHFIWLFAFYDETSFSVCCSFAAISIAIANREQLSTAIEYFSCFIQVFCVCFRLLSITFRIGQVFIFVCCFVCIVSFTFCMLFRMHRRWLRMNML